MKNRSCRRLPLLFAVVAGLAAWIFYPALLELVSAPIRQTFVPRMPSEIFFHQLKTTVAFSALGFLVPLAAILTSRGKSDRIFLRSLTFFTALSLLIAISTSWVMYAQLAYFSEFISELEAKNPGIPTQSHYSMISLYRIATYPSYLVLSFVAFTLIRTRKDKNKKPEQVGAGDAEEAV